MSDIIAAREQLEIIRRTAERGIRLARAQDFTGLLDSSTVDVFQHILDEIALAKTYLEN